MYYIWGNMIYDTHNTYILKYHTYILIQCTDPSNHFNGIDELHITSLESILYHQF